MPEAAVLIEQATPYRAEPKPGYNRSPEFLQFVRSEKKRQANPNKSTDLSQAKVVQRLAYKVVASLEADLDAATDAKSRMNVAVAIRSAIQAWDLARDAARIARNKPLPGSLRPENIQKKKKVTQHTFAEIPPPVVGAQVSNISKNLSAGESSSGPSTSKAKETLTATPRPTESSPSGFGMTEPE